ncbi:nitrile hydratase beta subunit [Caldalkalibacillus thermarum TA2.A1]|uniref:Nitrile hydratase accessory protein n=1 Tax=Caldalkalibacillus thermarum (strain TA2.A1) TaxID=986075 RepID=F5L3T1_CALTT|nr:nitrile hydratase accessory protein [Caldalkalibacillus thermarum]EGL84004.1 nitrile hydratase beta subunit [Caldalkalibacillus thermarum TA2.A1]QZT33069.1 nitrile hydratase accessory protein [Caldalkalibacillus thermarum TA2.A1]
MEKNCVSQSVDSKIAYLPESAAPPRKNGELVFEEPWERRSFGMALALYEEKRYTSWDDFRTRLIQEIAKWESSENQDKLDWNYYEHWLAALEQLVVETGMIDKHDIDARTKEFLSGERDEFF